MGSQKSQAAPSVAELEALTLATAAPFRFDRVEFGIRVVVSAKLPVSAGLQYERWLKDAVTEVRPVLKPFIPLVVAMRRPEEEEATRFATAIGEAAVVVWWHRKRWYAGKRPPVTAGTLEHEAAHIFSLRSQLPSNEDWEEAMREDSDLSGAGLEACLVDPKIASAYEPHEWITEDWAYSVERSRDARFATRFPARRRQIDKAFAQHDHGQTGLNLT